MFVYRPLRRQLPSQEESLRFLSVKLSIWQLLVLLQSQFYYTSNAPLAHCARSKFANAFVGVIYICTTKGNRHICHSAKQDRPSRLLKLVPSGYLKGRVFWSLTRFACCETAHNPNSIIDSSNTRLPKANHGPAKWRDCDHNHTLRHSFCSSMSMALQNKRTGDGRINNRYWIL